MKNYLKKLLALVITLSLVFGIEAVPAAAKAKAKTTEIKGIVAPLTVVTTEEGGLVGGSNVSSWNVEGAFSSDFKSYKVSADIYLPLGMFVNDGSVFINPMVSFWFPELGVNGYLENEITICVGFDFVTGSPFFKGGVRSNGDLTEELPFVKNVELVDDMVKVEIVDATVNPTFKTNEWDETTGLNKPWKDAIPKRGDAVPEFRVGTDRPYNGLFAVANASIKVGDKEYKTDYNKAGFISGFNGEYEGYRELEASTFRTAAVSVDKTSVKVKKNKTAAITVTTMFDSDEVTVSSSSAKVAKVTYKDGKLTIKGLKKGKATVTVEANGQKKTIKVTVKK